MGIIDKAGAPREERRYFCELKYGKAIGEYSFAAFGEFVKDKGMFGEFAPYEFKQY